MINQQKPDELMRVANAIEEAVDKLKNKKNKKK